jgi:hypothetical protein
MRHVCWRLRAAGISPLRGGCRNEAAAYVLALWTIVLLIPSPLALRSRPQMSLGRCASRELSRQRCQSSPIRQIRTKVQIETRIEHAKGQGGRPRSLNIQALTSERAGGNLQRRPWHAEFSCQVSARACVQVHRRIGPSRWRCVWRRGWDSDPTGLFRLRKLQIPQCRDCRRCQDRRGALHAVTR